MESIAMTDVPGQHLSPGIVYVPVPPASSLGRIRIPSPRTASFWCVPPAGDRTGQVLAAGRRLVAASNAMPSASAMARRAE